MGRDRKHPHERGEDRRTGCQDPPRTETPPRAWGRRAEVRDAARELGNTPTSVGKTNISHQIMTVIKKHPHERGEDAESDGVDCLVSETPPRAWGRLAELELGDGYGRNTPTSVGKTYAITARRK